MVAVGLAEGTSHVNWSLLRTILLWWVVGFGVVIMLTGAFVSQGKLELLAMHRPPNGNLQVSAVQQTSSKHPKAKE